MRAVWITLGLAFTALGFLGLALPLLPGTPFFLVAAWAFARSSPRLHAWLLGLPHIGPILCDYAAGLGIPRRAKLLAALAAALVVSISAVLATSVAVKVAVLVMGAIGVGFVLWRVPTREQVMAERAAAAECSADV